MDRKKANFTKFHVNMMGLPIKNCVNLSFLGSCHWNRNHDAFFNYIILNFSRDPRMETLASVRASLKEMYILEGRLPSLVNKLTSEFVGFYPTHARAPLFVVKLGEVHRLWTRELHRMSTGRVASLPVI